MTTTMTPLQETLRQAIVNFYLETGDDCTVKEVAVRIGWSESKVRKHLNDPHGFCLNGIRQSETARRSHSRDYPAFESGGHRVTVYGPSRSLLREMILAASGAAAKAPTTP